MFLGMLEVQPPPSLPLMLSFSHIFDETFETFEFKFECLSPMQRYGMLVLQSAQAKHCND